MYTRAVMDKDWRHNLDPNETNWFLDNRAKWGNLTYTSIRVILVLWIINGVGQLYLFLSSNSSVHIDI